MPHVVLGPARIGFRTTPATISDLDAILQIEQQSFTAPWTRKMFEAELSGNKFGHLWSARLPGEDDSPERLVGYISFWLVFEEFRLMTLAVAPGYRRHGIARVLLQQALLWAGDRGAGRALLEVRASNIAAIRLYEQAGYQATGMRQRYYTDPVEDAVMMTMEPITVTAQPITNTETGMK
jgi:ribosomal-protein-alanine N-acetyltransferase